MKYYEIKAKLEDLYVFSLKDVVSIDPAFRLPTLYDWDSKGLVKRLRNNNYVFADYEPHDKDYYFIANRLYTPSYVSLETALAFYNVLPEAVQTITSVTTNKTNVFDTPFGKFTYSSMSPDLFFGYKNIAIDNHSAQLANLEKAILDYLYLNSHINSLEDFESLRWNKDVLTESLDLETFEKFLIIFDNNALGKRCVKFMEFLDA